MSREVLPSNIYPFDYIHHGRRMRGYLVRCQRDRRIVQGSVYVTRTRNPAQALALAKEVRALMLQVAGPATIGRPRGRSLPPERLGTVTLRQRKEYRSSLKRTVIFEYYEARINGGACKPLTFSASCGLYGHQKARKLCEEALPRLRRAYAKALQQKQRKSVRDPTSRTDTGSARRQRKNTTRAGA